MAHRARLQSETAFCLALGLAKAVGGGIGNEAFTQLVETAFDLCLAGIQAHDRRAAVA